MKLKRSSKHVGVARLVGVVCVALIAFYSSSRRPLATERRTAMSSRATPTRPAPMLVPEARAIRRSPAARCLSPRESVINATVGVGFSSMIQCPASGRTAPVTSVATLRMLVAIVVPNDFSPPMATAVRQVQVRPAKCESRLGRAHRYPLEDFPRVWERQKKSPLVLSQCAVGRVSLYGQGHYRPHALRKGTHHETARQ